MSCGPEINDSTADPVAPAHGQHLALAILIATDDRRFAVGIGGMSSTTLAGWVAMPETNPDGPEYTGQPKRRRAKTKENE
jgi:hypothetical protein